MCNFVHYNASKGMSDTISDGVPSANLKITTSNGQLQMAIDAGTNTERSSRRQSKEVHQSPDGQACTTTILCHALDPGGSQESSLPSSLEPVSACPLSDALLPNAGATSITPQNCHSSHISIDLLVENNAITNQQNGATSTRTVLDSSNSQDTNESETAKLVSNEPVNGSAASNSIVPQLSQYTGAAFTGFREPCQDGCEPLYSSKLRIPNKELDELLAVMRRQSTPR